MADLARLKRRAEFLRVAGKGRKWVTPGLILQAAERTLSAPPVAPRVGYTASRKVGIAVLRNRARRRLREAAARLLPLHAAPERDYVMIARGGTLTRPFADLVGDLETALKRLGAWREEI
jgi:ribonuclease P protein component